jgi:hypothetical protein
MLVIPSLSGKFPILHRHAIFFSESDLLTSFCYDYDSFHNFSASSPCDDYSSPFDPNSAAEEMLFQLSASSSNNNNPTPPDSPSDGEPLIMDPSSLLMSSTADDVFFGATTDLKVESNAFENSAFWLE